MWILYAVILPVMLMERVIVYVDTENILAFFPMPFGSHFIGYKPLLMELATRGNNVTVVTASPHTEGYISENYHEIIVPNTLRDVELAAPDTDLSSNVGKFRFLMLIWELYVLLCNKISHLPEIQQLIHAEDTHFDLIMLEAFFQEPFITLGHRFNAPIVALIPMTPIPSVSKWAGNPSTFTYIPNSMIGMGGGMKNFFNRFLNSMIGLLHNFVEDWVYLPQQKAIMESAFNYAGSENRPPLQEMLRNVSVSLIFSDYNVLFARPMVPSYIEVSGIHIKESKLPQDLETIMNDSTSGVIYMSFGTHITPAMLPAIQIKKLLRVFAQFSQTIFWKYDGDQKKFIVPKNVVIRKWFPQIAILGHPKCRVFITHGGIHSILETVHFGVPILGMPFYADQPLNLHYAKEKGIALTSNFYSFTEESLTEMLNELLTDEKYKNQAKNLSALYHDKPKPPMETAVYWVEHTLRHRNSAKLLSDIKSLQWLGRNAADDYRLHYGIVIIVIICLSFFIGKITPSVIKMFFATCFVVKGVWNMIQNFRNGTAIPPMFGYHRHMYYND